MNCPKSRHLILLAVAAAAVLLPGILVAGEKPPARLEKLIPDDVIAYARFVDLTEKVEAFLDSEIKQKIVSSPLFEELLEDRELRRGLKRIRELEETTRLDLMKLLRDVFRREVAIGFFLDFSGLQGVVLARFGDGEEARSLVKRLRDAATDATGQPFQGTRSEYEGETIETFKSMAFAVIDDVLAIANQAGVLESVVDLAIGRTTRSVYHSKTFGPVVKDGRPLFQLALRPNFLPAVRLPQKLDSLSSLLFGGWLGAIHASHLLVVDLDLEKAGLVLRGASLVGSRGLGEKYRPWFPQEDTGSVVERLKDRSLAVVEVHRDLAAWWANRDDLVVARASGKMAAFAQYVSVVFGGSDLEREVLREIGSPITLVTQRQHYPGATPEPAIPGFAVIVPLRNPAEFGATLLAAVRRLVGIARFEQLRRNSGRDVELNLKTKEVGGRVLYHVDLKRREGAAAGLIDNFSPCLVILDAHAVLSSTTALAESLIRDLKGVSVRREEPTGATGSIARSTTDVLSLDCAELRRVLQDNHRILRREKGSWTDDWGDGLRAVASFLELFEDVRLSSVRKGDIVRLKLELSVEVR